jgi:hypothetical protein
VAALVALFSPLSAALTAAFGSRIVGAELSLEELLLSF